MPKLTQPVWLLSMDSEQFYSAPMTTGTLKAWYKAYSPRAEQVDMQLVHFRDSDAVAQWRQQWQQELLGRARSALEAGIQPIVGISCYTWNAADFLALVRFLRASCPALLIVAGGPHVQHADTFLRDDPIDVVVLGGGEITLQELVDASDRREWPSIQGIAFLADGEVRRTPERERITDLDSIPSPLDVVPLTDDQGLPLYESVAYETTRGCPYKCAFCEWGTGDIGSRMHQFSLARIRQDWNRITAAGIRNIWLADSNFGALREDLDKARLICELKNSTGLPTTFATSWSKKHSTRVQQIVLMLHRHRLLPYYQLALQTLTPLALELSNRKNMAANKYEPIAREMAAAGVPIAAELIWGLPGDNLADFERNLDRLLATFPNINIFGYTLLPGTEFFEKREQYRIDTIPVAGYGKAKGEYVIGCHTFGREEGIEGYFLIAAHIILIHGHITALTIRYLAMLDGAAATPLLRKILAALVDEYRLAFQQTDGNIKMAVYEQRAELYLLFLADLDRSYRVIENTLLAWLDDCGVDGDLACQAVRVLQLDKARCPRRGAGHSVYIELDFDGTSVNRQLEALHLPARQDFNPSRHFVRVDHPGGVGDVLRGPDGSSWIRGQLAEVSEAVELISASV